MKKSIIQFFILSLPASCIALRGWLYIMGMMGPIGADRGFAGFMFCIINYTISFAVVSLLNDGKKDQR